MGEAAVDLPAAEDADELDGSSTKIELARAYLDIGDVEGARGMLEEVLAEAGPAGRAEAERLLREIG
jgi:pilus assembly protein FimV